MVEDVRKENRFCVQRFITPKACSLGLGVVVVGEGVVGRRTRISPILFFTDMCNIYGIQKIYSSLDGAFLST